MSLPCRFGKYELIEHLATGGMAELFVARPLERLGRPVVLKRLRPELAQDARVAAMLSQEARIGLRLDHPNIARVFEFDRSEGVDYIAMEFLHGKDLAQLGRALRQQQRSFSAPEAVATIAEVCRGLGYAHRRTDENGRPLGLVHRDVSPHNIVLTFGGEVKLVDFGIARLLHGPFPSTAGKGGKIAYMSPEQARGEPVDARSDVFSVAVVLWELLVGRRLYAAEDPEERLLQVKGALRPAWSDLTRPVDAGLRAVLDRALDQDPDQRPASGDELEEELRAWLFNGRHRIEPAQLGALVRRAFPDIPTEPAGHLPLAEIAAHFGKPSPDPPRAQAPLAVGEQRPVVIAVLEFDGFTQWSLTAEPEQRFAEHLRSLLWLRRLADRHGGVLQRVVDDQVTVLFGVPRSQTDDLQRALELARAATTRAPQLSRPGRSISLAVGVHLGEVVLGRVRRRLRYLPRGDAARLPRRLSTLADRGEVLVSEDIVRGAGEHFRFRRGPALPMRRGSQKPSWILDDRARSLGARAPGPWYPRGEEFDWIRDALSDLEGGRGRVLRVYGRSGIGKSRFLQEVRYSALRRAPVFTTRGLAAPTAHPLEPIRDLALELLGLEARAPRETLESALTQLSERGLHASALPALRTLTGLVPTPLPPERLGAALGQAMLSLARWGPVLVLVDDLHLFSPAALQALDALLALRQRHPILFLAASATSASPPLPGDTLALELQPLPLERQSRWLAHLAGAERADQALVELASRTCEGNPRYLEETARLLLAEGRIVVEQGLARLLDPLTPAALPSSLAGLLASRIDALPSAGRGLLQLAAVAGPAFDETLLARAAGLDDATSLLLDLVSAGLIRPGAARGSWEFASELVHSAALRATQGSRRRELHRLVLVALESCSEGQPLPHDAMQHHAFGAGQFVEAADHALRAAEAFEQAQLLDRSKQMVDRGLQALDRHRQTHRRPTRLELELEARLRQRLGQVLFWQGQVPPAEHQLRLALDIAADIELPSLEAQIHLALGRSAMARTLPDRARAHLDQAAALLLDTPGGELHAALLEARADLAQEVGQFELAEELWENALRQAEGDPRARGRISLAQATRALQAGLEQRAEDLLTLSLTAARSCGDRILEGRALNNLGLLHLQRNQVDAALHAFSEALQVREGLGYARGVVVNHHNLGCCHLRAENPARAWVSFQRSRLLATELGWRIGQLMNDLYLWFLAGKQDLPSPMDLEALLGELESLEDWDLYAQGLLLRARLSLHRGDHGSARADLERVPRVTRGRHHQRVSEAQALLAILDEASPG